MTLLKNFPAKNRVLVTGGAGFIGSAVIRKLLKDSECIIYNLDKISYASDLLSIDYLLKKQNKDFQRHYLLKIDLSNSSEVNSAVKYANPDFILHLAAESHVDRSINGPKAFIESNILGTFNLLESIRSHYDNLSSHRKNLFRFLHISTDEVFGSLGEKGFFNESTRYDPRSPYSASKAASDHLVNAWNHTYDLPILMTNCSNNYGPWQHKEKLIPKIIYNAFNDSPIPIYGDGKNVRDWIFVEDHVNGLIKVLNDGKIGEKYCIGGNEEKTNNNVVYTICKILNDMLPRDRPYEELITYVTDRLGHDKRYAIDSSKIKSELDWEPKYSFEDALKITISWYLKKFQRESQNKF